MNISPGSLPKKGVCGLKISISPKTTMAPPTISSILPIPVILLAPRDCLERRISAEVRDGFSCPLHFWAD